LPTSVLDAFVAEDSDFLLAFLAGGTAVTVSSGSPPRKKRILNVGASSDPKYMTYLRARKIILPTMLRYITGVHLAGESLRDAGSGVNATAALVVKRVSYTANESWLTTGPERSYHATDQSPGDILVVP
jgi:hypothetical protein